MSTEVTCPACATISHFDEVGRDASAFCRTCDYPLFWSRSVQLATAAAAGGAGLRRLPGTVGRTTVAMLECPACTEPNLVTSSVCIRCGADLHPAPVVEATAVVAPPEVAEPPGPTPRRWPWVLLSVAALLGAVLLLIGLLTS